MSYSKDKINYVKLFNNIRNDPYYKTNIIYKEFNGNVPHISSAPKLEEFGLTQDVEDIIEKEKEQSKRLEDFIHVIVLGVPFVILMCFYYYNALPNFELTFTNIMKAIGLLLCGIVIYIAPAMLLYELSKKIANLFKRKESDTSKKYNQFKAARRAYEYWLDLKEINYWEKMDGHTFEKAVASVYESQGYKAVVSKAGGDGGIDIVLTKGGEKIAVQCKAHKKPVGPSVARDLYGTMTHSGYSKGILVSMNGFTSGVEAFVKGKSIQLITLNNLLYMMKNQ